MTNTSLGSQNQQWYRRPLGCPNCQAKGRGESCDHCHICGSSDQWARGCRKKKSSGDKAGSRNRRGLRYCVQGCQKLHWSSHKRLCQAIEHLETQKRSRVERGDGYVFVSHLTPKQHVVVANLVGKKCKVSCVLNGVPVEALSDTGAKVCIASKIWLEEYLPSLKDKTN